MKKTICCILSFMFAIGLAACQSTPNPEDTVKGYFEAAKVSDAEKMNSFVNPKNVSSEDSSSTSSEDSEDKEEMDLVNDLLDYIKGNNKKVTYNIKSTEVKENNAAVTVNCKFVDASAILKDSIADYIPQAFAKAFTGQQDAKESSKEIAELMKNKIQTTKETFAEKAVKVNCVKVEGKWYIDKVDDDLQNVFSSNLVSAGKDLSKSFSGSDSSGSASTSSQSETAKMKLSKINDYVISDIWNKGFCDISSYLADGKSSTGESLDIDFTIQQLDAAMEKKPDYDSYISKLDDSKYSNIKNIWTKLSSETDSLYKTVKAKKPVASSNATFDTGKFQQYQEAFSDAVDKVQE